MSGIVTLSSGPHDRTPSAFSSVGADAAASVLGVAVRATSALGQTMSGIGAPASPSLSGRISANDYLSLETFFMWGSVVPLIAAPIGIARMAYGVMLVAQGVIETANIIHNNSAEARLKLPENYLRESGSPLLTGFWHIYAGYSAQCFSLMRLVNLIAEKYLFQMVSPDFKIEATVDAKAMGIFWSRIKESSLYTSAANHFADLKARALGPIFQEGEGERTLASSTPTRRRAAPMDADTPDNVGAFDYWVPGARFIRQSLGWGALPANPRDSTTGLPGSSPGAPDLATGE